MIAEEKVIKNEFAVGFSALSHEWFHFVADFIIAKAWTINEIFLPRARDDFMYVIRNAAVSRCHVRWNN